MHIIDLHCDSATDVFGGAEFVKKYNFSNVYPQIQTAAIFTRRKNTTTEKMREYLFECESRLNKQLKREGLVYIKTKEELRRTVSLGESGVILSIEGGGGLDGSCEELLEIYNRGARIFGIAWDRNELSASAFDTYDTGLTELGRKTAIRCAELGFILDASHLSDNAFYDLFSSVSSPIIATHSNFREIANNKRNLTHDMAEMIAERGGIIGLNIYPPHMSDSKGAKIEDIFLHIDYALNIGIEDSISFGFDIDGVGGNYPVGVGENESIHDVTVSLILKRYGKLLSEKISGKNAFDFFMRTLK